MTLIELAERRGDTGLAATGRRVADQRLRRAVLALSLPDSSIVVPAFQLTATGEPRPELRPLLEQLLGAGVDGWAAWTGLTQPSSYLSGDVSEQIADVEPERAAQARRRGSSRRRQNR